jgi:hypothetical protein
MNAEAQANASELMVRAERVVRLGEEMSDLMEYETSGIVRSQLGDYGTLVKKKQQLLLDYQGAVKSLLSLRENLNSLTPPMRAQLKATGSRLDAVAHQNAEKLSVTAAATHKVLQVVIDTIRRETAHNQPQGYSPSQFQSYRDERMPASQAILVTEKA